MAESPMRGVFPILVTPFDNSSRIDEESLRKLIDFNVDSGVHGLGVALGSEVFKLSEAERVKVTRIVVDQVNGRVPVVINTGAAGTDLAVEYSVTAEENGANALMVMPPSFGPVPIAAVLEYFKPVSDVVDIPVFIQDTDASPVPAALARRIAEESENVRYIKVESLPTPAKVAAAGAAKAAAKAEAEPHADRARLPHELRRRHRARPGACAASTAAASSTSRVTVRRPRSRGSSVPAGDAASLGTSAPSARPAA